MGDVAMRGVMWRKIKAECRPLFGEINLLYKYIDLFVYLFVWLIICK